jgi:hypothetical protein
MRAPAASNEESILLKPEEVKWKYTKKSNKNVLSDRKGNIQHGYNPQTLREI